MGILGSYGTYAYIYICMCSASVNTFKFSKIVAPILHPLAVYECCLFHIVSV